MCDFLFFGDIKADIEIKRQAVKANRVVSALVALTYELERTVNDSNMSVDAPPVVRRIEIESSSIFLWYEELLHANAQLNGDDKEPECSFDSHFHQVDGK